MASSVQICNLALAELDAAPIMALDDNSREAIRCSIFFDDIVKEVMASGTWSCLIRRATLNQLADAPEFGYSYQYQLPTNPKLLKVITLNSASDGSIPFSIEDDKLLTDSSTVELIYTAYITTSESWNIYLQQAIVAKLAAVLAFPITGNMQVAQMKAQQYYQIVLPRCLALDGQMSSKDSIISSDLRDVR